MQYLGFRLKGEKKKLKAVTANTRKDTVSYAFITDREHCEKIDFLFWREKCVVCIERR